MIEIKQTELMKKYITLIFTCKHVVNNTFQLAVPQLAVQDLASNNFCAHLWEMLSLEIYLHDDTTAIQATVVLII